MVAAPPATPASGDEPLAAGERTRLVLTHSGIQRPTGALDYSSGWNSHLAVLQEKLADRDVPDFWALHARSRDAVAKAFG